MPSAQDLEKVAQDNRWKYVQQCKSQSEVNSKKNMVKQILPDFGYDSIVHHFHKLEFSRPCGKFII